MAKMAWQEQRDIGWIHMLKGRLSKTWGMIQHRFYKEHPDLKDKKNCTGLSWTIRMMKELTGMLLEMWANRCGCLHGHTKAEKKLRKRAAIERKVRKCYGRREEVLREHQDIFEQPLEEMVKQRTTFYMSAWVNMFYSLVLLSDRTRGRGRGTSDEERTVGTFDTEYDMMDYVDYLVDTTDGMDREWDIGEQGAVLTPSIRNPYKSEIGHHGGYELNKRKPPDGKP